jgi:hypothetical protein
MPSDFYCFFVLSYSAKLKLASSIKLWLAQTPP